jgi:amino acid transporter
VLSATGPKLIDRAQSVIVGLLLIVFTVFVVTTLPNADFSLMAPSTYPDAGSIVSSVALTFFAFLGFGVITFVTGDLRDPRRQLPIAVYAALAITTILYVSVALSVFGTLTVDEVIAAGPLALAQAAEPALGQAGYAMMTLAALLATASSVTAILYASVGLTKSLAEAGTFPGAFGPRGRLGRHGGLIITATLMVIFVLALSLEALASVGSAVSLAVFFLVAWAAFRLRAELKASSVLKALAAVASGIVLVWFAIDLYVNQKRSFWAMVILVFLAVIVDELWMRRRRARTASEAPTTG